MKYMLDTNICIAAMRNDELMERVVGLFDKCCISAITLSELEYGVQHSAQAAKNRDALTEFITTIAVIPFDNDSAHEYGDIRNILVSSGKQIGLMDTLIAAYARSLGLILVTNNTREFEHVPGLMIEDWI